jgi:hypothetical protein
MRIDGLAQNQQKRRGKHQAEGRQTIASPTPATKSPAEEELKMTDTIEYRPVADRTSVPLPNFDTLGAVEVRRYDGPTAQERSDDVCEKFSLERRSASIFECALWAKDCPQLSPTHLFRLHFFK